MFKFVILAACVFATAQGGAILATAPVLSAPLLGKVTTLPAETTIVKQQVIVDQPEIRYRSVPTVVQTAPIVKTVQPIVHAAPALTYAAAPALSYAAAVPAVRTIAAGTHLTYAAAPAFNAYNWNGFPAATYAAW
ncbi:cuticle protein 16.5 [Folsomia candida]|uniref:Uncharacterized protein n=1 Tax=Folsomia candida TaxID=158441 RepID=A0A226DA40_FOLCA|nr:cuticle protein 16.5 [Folsomia candida]OXA41748.1 hypothetical protein Fcan01_23448 [Folsomia candida]